MIKIIDGYGFEQDDMQFTLYAIGKRQKASCFGRTAADGEMIEYKDTLGYYSSVQSMCEACLKHAVKARADRDQIDSIGEYVAAMKEIASDIRESIGTYKF